MCVNKQIALGRNIYSPGVCSCQHPSRGSSRWGGLGIEGHTHTHRLSFKRWNLSSVRILIEEQGRGTIEQGGVPSLEAHVPVPDVKRIWSLGRTQNNTHREPSNVWSTLRMSGILNLFPMSSRVMMPDSTVPFVQHQARSVQPCQGHDRIGEPTVIYQHFTLRVTRRKKRHWHCELDRADVGVDILDLYSRAIDLDGHVLFGSRGHASPGFHQGTTLSPEPILGQGGRPEELSLLIVHEVPCP